MSLAASDILPPAAQQKLHLCISLETIWLYPSRLGGSCSLQRTATWSGDWACGCEATSETEDCARLVGALTCEVSSCMRAIELSV
jgi:hypothetical protein